MWVVPALWVSRVKGSAYCVLSAGVHMICYEKDASVRDKMLGETCLLLRPLLFTTAGFSHRFQSSLTRVHKLDNRFQ
jgi:hypothetical protein